MLIFIFILFDLVFFSVLSIPFYRFLCDSGLPFFFLFGDILLAPFGSSFVFYIIYFDLYCLYICNVFSTCFYCFIFMGIEEILGFVFIVWRVLSSSCSSFSTCTFNILELSLYVRRSTLGLIEFYSLQQGLYVFYDEISLAFFRVYNPTHYLCTCVFIYLIYPLFSSIYINKIQCFCFENITIHRLEIFDLPVLFFICSAVQQKISFFSNKIALLYVLFVL